MNPSYEFTTAEAIYSLIRPRDPFAHKGSFGHALIIAGSKGKMGAAVLATKACLRSGAGLVTAHIPSRGEVIMQTACPEAMVECDICPDCVSGIPLSPSFDAIGIGPGLGTHELTFNAISDLFYGMEKPLVIDADAINLISQSPLLSSAIPPNSILTPHPKEFDRLAGKSIDAEDRLRKARDVARGNQLYIVLKGANTAICSPDGRVRINPTGNSGMATAGSGDVLTGIITGLLAQHYSPEEAAMIGVYIHGKAGDLAAASLSQEGMIAGDIITYLPNAFKQ